jgi:thioredoxin-dependent peroxiredoxin
MKALRIFAVAALALGLGVLALRALAADPAKGEVKEGDAAPSFEATDDSGKPWKLDDHVGKKVVVVYFYPADFTGGCTKQACGFRDDMEKLTGKGVEVVGISCDAVKTHEAFKKFHKLNFTLLSDEDGTIAGKYGVPVTKGDATAKGTDVDGKDATFARKNTASRWTFVIGKDGKIAFKNSKVNAGEDSKQILEVIEKLNK